MEKKVRVFKHLTFTDRLRIEKWLSEGLRPREIADRLRVHYTTVYREIKRGEYERRDGKTWRMIKSYSPEIAEKKYQDGLRAKGPNLKIGKDHALAQYIEQTMLDRDCSPAAVLGYIQNEGLTFQTSLSKQTIYNYIKAGVFLHLTQRDLPRRGERKNKYRTVVKKAARAPAGESIEKRPPEVLLREAFGDWEMDTVYSGTGKNHSTRALLVMTERVTRKEILIPIPNRKAASTVKALDELEAKVGAKSFRALFHSITVDNGSEFAQSDEIERSCLEEGVKRTRLYFCHPYSSHERGSNENQNIMVRRKHKKGTNFEDVSNEEIANTESWINNYPRGIFSYQSSDMRFEACLREIGLAELKGVV